MHVIARWRGRAERRNVQPWSVVAVVPDAAPADPEAIDDVSNEDEVFESPHRETTRWGAERFAIEFRRREEEERRAARAERWEQGRLGARPDAEPSMEALTHGPVAAEVVDAVVEPQVDELPLQPYVKHPPRSPTARGARRARVVSTA